MAEAILFNTAEAVVELLWDIALALFIVRISFVYFILPYITGILFSYWTSTKLVPVNHFTAPQSELIVLPLQLLVIFLWGRTIVSYYDIPQSLQFRLAIGGLATTFMITAEASTALLLYVEGSPGWLWETDYEVALLFTGLLAAFCFMPAWLMALEIRHHAPKETSHGHETKSLFNAVPIISIGRKRKQEPEKLS